SIPDSKGVIHGCYANTSPHTLRVIDTAVTGSCPSGTTPLNWNVKGPPGPSNAYAAHHDGAVSLSQSGSTLLTLNLAAGSYVVTAKAQIDTTQECSGVPCQIKTFPTCTLTAGADSDTVSQGTEGSTSSNSFVDRMAAAMNLVVVHSSTTSFTASFVCADGLTDLAPMGAVATFSKIVAVKVGSVSNAAE
ncbi:MAG: hypothetical protein ACTHNU_02780, partial [Gaiellales bacterium]